MPKIAFSRAFALETLHIEQDEDILTGVIKAEDRLDLEAMSNDQLAEQLHKQGFVQQQDLGGVFKQLPPQYTDARDLYLVMGWPLVWKES